MTTRGIKRSLSKQNVVDGVSEAVLEQPTNAEILADVKTGLQQALAGEGRPVRAEIRRKIAQDAWPWLKRCPACGAYQ